MKIENVVRLVDSIELLVKELKKEMDVPTSVLSTSATPNDGEYECPDCGSEMVLRTNREKGTKFYGCKKYPLCKGTRDEEGLSRAEREEQKYKKELVNQESGFSFNRAKRNPVTEVSPENISTKWINPFEKK